MHFTCNAKIRDFQEIVIEKWISDPPVKRYEATFSLFLWKFC